LPRTAIKELEPLIESAIKDKDYPEAIKATIRKIALEGTIEGNKPEERVVRLKAAIDKLPKEMHPVLDAVLAHWTWHYYEQNRWRFLQRTTTAAPVGDDLTTWDLPRIMAEIDARFAKALANEKELKATPIGNYDKVIAKGSLSDEYRPTLFDFLVFDAVAFYAAAEQAGAKPQDAFEIEADGPALAPLAEFLKWEPKATDTDAPKLKVVKLLQNVLKFHEDDAKRTALLDADLLRLHLMSNLAVGPAKSGRYKLVLQEFAERNKDHELSALAQARFAQVLFNEGNRVEAKKVADAAVKAYPESVGGTMAYNLTQQILAKELSFNTERVWPGADALPPITVSYRNLTKVHFRAYKLDWDARVKSFEHQYNPDTTQVITNERVVKRPKGQGDDYLQFDHKAEWPEILKGKPTHAWESAVPETPDFNLRSEKVTTPKGFEPGFYMVFASADGEFREGQSPTYATGVWVSELALVMRHGEPDAPTGGMVVNARTGEPVEGAKVRVWTWVHHQKRNNVNHYWNERVEVEPTKTDKNGLFATTAKGNESYIVQASHNGQVVANGHDHHSWWGHRDRPRAHHQVVLFTDRTLYRPGQTVRYKGVLISTDHHADAYATVANQSVSVQFTDPNGKMISTATAKTNDFGSFSGSFVAPRDRLTGAMSIAVHGAGYGQTVVHVEEYKRPQFIVTLDTPKTPARLGEPVTVTGKATAYTGSAVGGAKVQFRVSREVRYPRWWHDCYWWMPVPSSPAQEIVHGGAVTNPDGSFEVKFPATPDRTVPAEQEPTFSYKVTADVTDTTGETRSADRSVRVGYAALEAELNAPDWNTATGDVKFDVSVKTLDDAGQKAKGTVKVYKLKQPEKVIRPEHSIAGFHGGHEFHDDMGFRKAGRRFHRPMPQPQPNGKPDASDPRSWELGEVVATIPFETAADGKVSVSAKLPVGAYRAVLETTDAFQKAVTARDTLTVLDPTAKTLALKVPNLLSAPKWSVQPGDEFEAVWGTGYDTGRAYVEVIHREKTLQAYWTDDGRTLNPIKQKVTEAMRGGFTLRVTYVRDNRAYLETRLVEVPWTNKELKVKWERFISKMEPGAKEKWAAVISGPDAKKAVAEMVATLYDASLDQYQAFAWMQRFGVFRQEYPHANGQFENAARGLNHLVGSFPGVGYKPVGTGTYRHFATDVTHSPWGYEWGPGGWEFHQQWYPGRGWRDDPFAMDKPAAGMAMEKEEFALRALNRMEAKKADYAAGAKPAPADANIGLDPELPNQGGAKPPAPNLDNVAARTNLNETAFFFPHLVSDDDGTVRMEFTMPEALTKWKFMAFAHDKELRSGSLSGETVTAKDLMVQPNAPRFLRDGDVLEFTVKVSNQSDTKQTGKVKLTFADARTGQPIDANLGNLDAERDFDVPAKESKAFSWRLTVPVGLGPVIYKAVGATDKFSDGEENILPVLSSRVLVTESLPLPIRGKQTKNFDFQKLIDSGKSDTLKHQAYTVQMTSNPSWYAIMALPYLMEYPHECNEQTFSRMYANLVARHIVNSDKKIHAIFEQWRNTPGVLDSPLEKNQDLKSVLLDETPWVRAATNESENRRRVGILFDDNRLNDEIGRAQNKLAQAQLPNGKWPWFPGDVRGNEYITLYLTTGYGRLRHLGVKVDVNPGIRALNSLDAWANEMYQEILRQEKLGHTKRGDNHLSHTIAMWLYGRSFFLKDQGIAQANQEAVDYWQSQAKKYWLQLGDRQSQAHLAIALKRFGVKETPDDIMKSIKERSVSNEEMGMFWRDQEHSYYWYRAPIETQAVMIEAFDEVSNDQTAVEDCKVWLLKQKQTTAWHTTKATADAVYALLLKGNNPLKSDALVEVTVGGVKIEPEKVEAGTGFYEHKFVKSEVKPEMGKIEVKKTDDGVAWGSVHWQYLEDVTKITPHDGTPLKLEKTVFKRVNTKKGPVLEPINGTVQVGDELVMRIVLRSDRNMEFIHLKDHRGSGTEPVNVMSKYKFQDGLGYYESTRDTCTNFFIDYLPKGTYVFEYPVRVVHRGKYPTGLASIQCMYAPEFNSHSASVTLEAK
jgi:uncharacterized protein YfaS (alpha-2-macroglobulin family)